MKKLCEFSTVRAGWDIYDTPENFCNFTKSILPLSRLALLKWEKGQFFGSKYAKQSIVDEKEHVYCPWYKPLCDALLTAMLVL